MERQAFKTLVSEKVFLLDGATGTELQKRGLTKGVCPEAWVLENPDVLRDVQRAYFEAGADAVYTCTFGANRLKLKEFNLHESVLDMNRRLAAISREVASDDHYVAGNLSPTGELVEPFGPLPFDQAVDIYREQITGLVEGGVDFLMIETMIDVQEARAAVLAAREVCNLPVCVSLTFDESARTLTGTDPATAALTLQALGADAIGCNCSTGPRPMRNVIRQMAEVASIPLLALPNAGIPRLVRGETVFSLSLSDFVRETRDLAAVVNLVGGCCGTSPEYIAGLREVVDTLDAPPVGCGVRNALTSVRHTVYPSPTSPITVIGERINPTGKETLKEQLRKGETGEIRRLAQEQSAASAGVLDVNVGASGVDEKSAMSSAVRLLASLCDLPLCIDSSDPAVVEHALRLYPGRALINSISAEGDKPDVLLPLAARYGAMFIALPIDDEGIPERAERRKRIIERLAERAAEVGLTKDDMVVDGLVMAVSSETRAARETLELIHWAANDFGVNTVVGLSNVSFGLPERHWVNATFLSAAADRGLSMVIGNPSSKALMETKRAADLLVGRDEGAKRYTAAFAPADSEPDDAAHPVAGTALEPVYSAVVEGDVEGMVPVVRAALDAGYDADTLMHQALIPGVTRVGELFEKAIYFLPQLIRSAEAMQRGFGHLQPLLEREDDGEKDGTNTILLATVKGDIHDIGKNIVAIMLRNYGFDVHDLGKDVAAEDILAAARETGAAVIGLSALMTTTMVAMKEVIEMARERGLDCRFMIGGAAVDRAYAAEIGADGYADDAYAAVKETQRLTARQNAG